MGSYWLDERMQSKCEHAEESGTVKMVQLQVEVCMEKLLITCLCLFSLTAEGMSLIPCLVCSRSLSREWRIYKKEKRLDTHRHTLHLLYLKLSKVSRYLRIVEEQCVLVRATGLPLLSNGNKWLCFLTKCMMLLWPDDKAPWYFHCC